MNNLNPLKSSATSNASAMSDKCPEFIRVYLGGKRFQSFRDIEAFGSRFSHYD